MSNKLALTTFLDKLALFISGLFSPYLVCALFSCWIIYHYSVSWQQWLLLSVGFIFFSVVIVLGFVLWRIHQGVYSDIHVAVRSQREELFLVATISAGILALFFRLEQVNIAIVAMAVVLFVNGIIFGAISHWWKISMHAAAIAQAAIIGSILISPDALLLLLVLPAIAWARLHRSRHSVAQTIAAAIIVLLTTPLLFWEMGLL